MIFVQFYNKLFSAQIFNFPQGGPAWNCSSYRGRKRQDRQTENPKCVLQKISKAYWEIKYNESGREIKIII